MENINTIMNNSENAYYGHGTGTDSQEILLSILENGLRCSHESLYFTSVTFGIGQSIDDNVKQLLKNWPHQESKKIIILSLPIKFNILDSPSILTYNKGQSAYYYTPDEEKQKTFRLTNSSYVMPQFILGYYDAITDEFHRNPGYYELLPEEKQEELFDKVKRNYVEILEDACGAIEYKSIIEELPGWTFPLTDEELEKYLEKTNQTEIRR